MSYITHIVWNPAIKQFLGIQRFPDGTKNTVILVKDVMIKNVENLRKKKTLAHTMHTLHLDNFFEVYDLSDFQIYSENYYQSREKNFSDESTDFTWTEEEFHLVCYWLNNAIMEK